MIFFGHGLDAKFRSDRLARRGVMAPALIDSVRDGETAEDVKKRLGKPAEEHWRECGSGASGNAPGMRGRRPT